MREGNRKRWDITAIVFILQERKRKQGKTEKTGIRTRKEKCTKINICGFQMYQSEEWR